MIFMGEYQRAIEWSEKALSIPNCQYWASAHLMVANALLGNGLERDSAKEKLYESCPDFSVDFVKNKLFYLKKQDQIELYLKGLTKSDIC